jgi:acetylglutamate kinase
MNTDPQILDPQVIVKALSYFRKWQNAVFVIKYGGSVSESAGDLKSFVEDLITLRSVGIKPIVVHGGGPQIGELMSKLGKTPEFIDGHRVTDKDTLDIARMVLVGKINRQIVSEINVHEPVAVGLSGEDAGLIKVKSKSEELGFVGEIVSVDPDILEKLISQGLIPVIATIGSDYSGQSYNINADSVAGEIAAAVKAEKLVFLTDQTGILKDKDDDKSVMSKITITEALKLIEDKTISGGMIPKVNACITAIEKGLNAAHILSGQIEHSLLIEIFTEGGIGTMIVK